MEDSVLDASALIALLRNERGAESVITLLPSACMSAVNEIEVIARSMRDGIPAERAVRLARDGVFRIVPFDKRQAEVSGTLFHRLRRRDLSLADCACLALGIVTELPVYTADRVWAELGLGVDVRLIR